MECPKCRKTVSDSDYNCPYCGTRIRSSPENSKGKKRIRINAKKAERDDPKRKRRFFGKKKSDGEKKTAGIRFGKKLKVTAVVLCIAILIVLAAVIISSVVSKKGESYAETASKYIGNNLSVLEGKEEMHFLDESEFFGVNSTVAFDYVMESDDKIKSEGISYPEWAVFLKMSDAKFITEVTYTDFTVIDKDLRGKKYRSQISLDSFDKGAKQSKVLNFIDMDPYSISYSQSGIITYTYKYYFTRDNGDEQAVILRAAFDESGTYRYYTSELIFPQNM